MLNKLANIQKELEVDGLLITNPLNIFYLTGVEADATYVIFDDNELKIVTNFIYFEDIKKNIKVESKVIMYSGDDLYKNFNPNYEYAFESAFMTFASHNQLSSKGLKLKPVDRIIETLRECKSQDEIEKIKKAVSITDKTFSAVLENIKPGMNEKEISDFIRNTQYSFGSEKNSFTTIAAVGVNSSLPHAVCSEKRVLKEGMMLKLDYGCMYEHYCSDMTRTIFFGKADEQFKKIYNIVLTAQLKAIEAIKLGIKAADIDKVARDYISEKGYGDKFGHGLGHGLGIEVHESPSVSPKSKSVLKEGNIITVEPGIYIPGWGGIRIEDDVVVTADGPVILNKSTKELIEI